MPFEKAKELRNNRRQNDGISNDIHESNLSFMKKVYDNSLLVAKRLNFEVVECTNNNEIRTIDDIHNEVYNKCTKVLKK